MAKAHNKMTKTYTKIKLKRENLKIKAINKYFNSI